MWDVCVDVLAQQALTSDHVRAWLASNVTLIAMANGSRSGFEVTNAALSRQLLSSAQRLLHSGLADAETAFNELRHASNELVQENDEEAGDAACGWLTIASIINDRLHAWWASSDEVWVIDRGNVVFRSRAHVASRMGLQHGSRSAALRGFGTPYQGVMPEEANHPLLSHQRVLVMSSAVWQAAPERELAAMASLGSLSDACSALLNASSAAGLPGLRAVAVAARA